MNKKILVVGILAALLMVLAPLSPVVGTSVVKSDVGKESPLFAVRTQRSLSKDTKKITSNYLGKDKQLNILLPEKSKEKLWMNRAIKLFDTNPALLNTLLEKLDKWPHIATMLNKYDLSKQDIKNYIEIIKNNPSILAEQIENIPAMDNTPQPLGLETSFECLITGIVGAIVAYVVTLLALFFTLRILTCLNVNNCAEDIMRKIFDQITQGLTPSDYS